MIWEKIGLIFDPDILKSEGLSAALMPICEVVNQEDDIVRVYFSPRDANNRSELRFFEIDLKYPQKILKVSKTLFKHGELGAFDDSGVTPGSVLLLNGRKFFYYTGWNLTVNVPVNNSIGFAEFFSETSVHRRGMGPILTRTLHEPFSCASPFVLFDKGLYKMWYASMDKWVLENGYPKHYYDIKYAESEDGIDWRKRGQCAISYCNADEYAFGRPFVLKEHGVFKMWYAYRGESYRIGYAESDDGISWQRKDALVGIDVSTTGWDSEMIEYPYILDHKAKRFMFYNGNGYGKSGIGLAILR